MAKVLFLLAIVMVDAMISIENVAYSRLNAPFFPLQRSDLDLLEMKAGTCGDYANLIVSVLQALGFDACYAYVYRDCYGDAKDHICAAVKENSRAIHIDATLPYRKWHGFDCPHRDYELLSADDFERRMKKEESYWQSVANEHHMDLLAGLLYAPWIHDERIFESDDRLDTAFFLLSFGKKLVLTLYVYYQHYTEQTSSLRVMATITRSETLFYFSVYPHDELWDDTQWSGGYEETNIPWEYDLKELQSLKLSISKNYGRINAILSQVGCDHL